MIRENNGFEVVVSTEKESISAAVASAGQYLSYADQTDTFPYADIIGVNLYNERNLSQPISVGLCFTLDNESDENIELFIEEMGLLSRVESLKIIPAAIPEE